MEKCLSKNCLSPSLSLSLTAPNVTNERRLEIKHQQRDRQSHHWHFLDAAREGFLGYVFQGREEVDKFVIGIIVKGLN